MNLTEVSKASARLVTASVGLKPNRLDCETEILHDSDGLSPYSPASTEPVPNCAVCALQSTEAQGLQDQDWDVDAVDSGWILINSFQFQCGFAICCH